MIFLLIILDALTDQKQRLLVETNDFFFKGRLIELTVRWGC